MKLLYVGDVNWDYYYDEQLKCVRSIAKKDQKAKGCLDSIFGSLDHTRRFFEREIERGETRELFFTANGCKVLSGESI